MSSAPEMTEICICDHAYRDHYITHGGDEGCSAQVIPERGPSYTCLCDGYMIFGIQLEGDSQGDC